MHGRQKLCTSCRPAWQNARAEARAARKETRQRQQTRVALADAVPQLAAGDAAERDYAAEFGKLCATRTAALMAWAATGAPFRSFPRWREMTGREISVAIGWLPWPSTWPAPPAELLREAA